VTAVDFEEQSVFCLEMIGHTAGIGAGSLRNVPNRNRVEAIRREQLFRGAQDRFPKNWLAG
jgi:hypothetical protein